MSFQFIVSRARCEYVKLEMSQVKKENNFFPLFIDWGRG